MKTCKPYTVGQAVWLKRPKTWKFGPKWIGPYEIIQRMGVNYKIRNRTGRISVVHHDHLKSSVIPLGDGQVVPPTPESGDIQVAQNVPERRNFDNGEVVRHMQPGVREARLRQNVRPPVRYGYDYDIPSRGIIKKKIIYIYIYIYIKKIFKKLYVFGTKKKEKGDSVTNRVKIDINLGVIIERTLINRK